MEAGPTEPLTPPQAPVPALRLAVAATVVILIFYLPAQLTLLLNPGFGLWFSETFVFFGLAFVLVRLSGRDPVRFTGLRWSGLAPAGYGFAFGAVNFIAIAIPLQFLAVWLFPESWSEAFDSGRILRDKTAVDLALVVAGVTIAAPIAEEYFFRGVVQRSIAESGWTSPRGALVLTGVLFSAFHVDPVGFVPRVELGIVFGWLFWRTGSIWPGVMAHAANNLISVVIFFLAGDEATAGGTAGAPTSAEVRQVVGLGVIGLIALGGLLLASSKQERWLAPRHPQVPVTEALAPRSFYALTWPWAVGAALSLALLFAVDSRGVALNVFDTQHPLPEAARKMEPEHRALLELRGRVRAGEAPLGEYQAQRLELIARYGEKEPQVPALPPPPLPPQAP